MPADRHERITVLARFSGISLFYSLAPLLLAKDVARQLDFTRSIEHCLRTDRNRNLLIIRIFEHIGLHNRLVDLELMARLREKYDRIAFFDDGDGAGCTRFEVLPFVDLYLKKQLFRDVSTYRRHLYGRQLFTDYYHRRMGVTDPEPNYRQPIDPQYESKLRVAWNLGVGSFPIRRPLQRIGIALANLGLPRRAFDLHSRPLNYRPDNQNLYDVHARFTPQHTRPTVFYQRRLLQQKIASCPQFLSGRVSPRRYQREIRHSKATLSPFGWGEICYRDFEAVLNKSLLLKPDMDHLTTWPDIYRPFETYVPLNWDGDNVLQQSDRFLHDTVARREIAGNALGLYQDELRRVEERAETVVHSILSPETSASCSSGCGPAKPHTLRPPLHGSIATKENSMGVTL